MVKLEGITKAFDSRKVLENCSLESKKGSGSFSWVKVDVAKPHYSGSSPDSINLIRGVF